jgi:hypothetical protein
VGDFSVEVGVLAMLDWVQHRECATGIDQNAPRAHHFVTEFRMGAARARLVKGRRSGPLWRWLN